MPWFHNLPSPTKHKFYSDLDQLTNEQSPILIGSKESHSVLHLMSQFPDMKQEVISMTLENRGIAVPIVGNVQQDAQKIDEWLCAIGNDTIAFVNHFTMLQLSSSDVVSSEYGIDIRLLDFSSKNSYTAKLCLKEFSADGSQSRLLYPGSGGYAHAGSLLQPRVTSTKESMPLDPQPQSHLLSKHLEHIVSTLAQFSAEDKAQGSHSPHLSQTRIFRLLCALHTSTGSSKKRESQEHHLFEEHLRKLSEGEYDFRVQQMGEGVAKPVKPPGQMRKFDGEESPNLEGTYKRYPGWERDLWTRPFKSEQQKEEAKTPMDASRRKRSPEHRRSSVLGTTLDHDISPKTKLSTPVQKMSAHPRLPSEHQTSPEHEQIPLTKTSPERNISPKTNPSTRRRKSPEHERPKTTPDHEISPTHQTSSHKKKASHSSTASDPKSARTLASTASTATKTLSVSSWSTLTKEEVEAFYAQSPVPKASKKVAEKGVRACLKARFEKFTSRLGKKT
ncbi:hypothetical protein BDV97DRAFT_410253 [Delphinella strobiligena]|nr:hypothetical protein BDV97DRAFT_410253 [Delphinella strobiligena]